MATAREGHTATLLGGGQVLVAGGLGSSRLLTSVELYDPPGGTWNTITAMGTARCYHTATLLGNGKVLVAGGQESSGTFLASAELYDPAMGIWTPPVYGHGPP